MTDNYLKTLIEFKEECDTMLDECVKINNHSSDDDIVSPDFIYEILKNVSIDGYLAGSSLLYLYDQKVGKPNDIDIYIDVNYKPIRGTCLDTNGRINNFVYKYKDVAFVANKIGVSTYAKRAVGIDGIYQTIDIYVDDVKLELHVQLIYVTKPVKYIKNNDFDICRYYVPHDDFKNLKNNIDKYIRKPFNMIANYMPGENYFNKQRGHYTLQSYRLIRIHKYFQKGFEIFYNKQPVDRVQPRNTIDKYLDKHPIDLLKDKIIIALEDLIAYKSNKIIANKKFAKFKELVQKNEMKISLLSSKTRNYFTMYDHVNAYINALELREKEKVEITMDEKYIDLTNLKKTINTIRFVYGLGMEYNTDNVYASVNTKAVTTSNNTLIQAYLDKSSLSTIETVKADEEEYVAPKRKLDKTEYVFDILAKIMNNKNMFITGGGAAHMIDNDLPCHDIDIYYHELEELNFDANIFGNETYDIKLQSFNLTSASKNISSVTNVFLYERVNDLVYKKPVSGYNLRRFNSVDSKVKDTVLKIQFISTTVNPIDVIMDFDFGASKGIIRSVNNEFDDITMPIYREMIRKRFTTYTLLPYNRTEYGCLNTDAAKRLARYFFRGFTIQSTELSKEGMEYSYGSIFTIRDILHTLYISYQKDNNNSYYSLEDFTQRYVNIMPEVFGKREYVMTVAIKIYMDEYFRTKYQISK